MTGNQSDLSAIEEDSFGSYLSPSSQLTAISAARNEERRSGKRSKTSPA